MKAYEIMKLIRNIIWNRYKIPYTSDDNEVTGVFETNIQRIYQLDSGDLLNLNLQGQSYHILLSTGTLGYHSDNIEIVYVIQKGWMSVVFDTNNIREILGRIIDSDKHIEKLLMNGEFFNQYLYFQKESRKRFQKQSKNILHNINLNEVYIPE